jgi:hypothetical protein
MERGDTEKNLRDEVGNLSYLRETNMINLIRRLRDADVYETLIEAQKLAIFPPFCSQTSL